MFYTIYEIYSYINNNIFNKKRDIKIIAEYSRKYYIILFYNGVKIKDIMVKHD